MSSAVLTAILIAALLHASWNALSKLIDDRLVASALIGIVYTIVGVCAVPFLPLPHGQAWPFIIASAIVQSVYLILLMQTYRYGDFGQTYPISRGLSPLLVSIVSLGFLGEHLSMLQLIGVAAICAGLASMIFSDGRPRRGRGYGLAAVTGVTIATYSLIDGVGVRHSGAVLSYAMWLFALQGALIVLISWQQRRNELRAALAPYWRVGALGGVGSVFAYAIVLWAQSRAPLASVATLRETSVLFAAVLGRLMFSERFGAVKVGSAVIVAAGIVSTAVA